MDPKHKSLHLSLQFVRLLLSNMNHKERYLKYKLALKWLDSRFEPHPNDPLQFQLIFLLNQLMLQF